MQTWIEGETLPRNFTLLANDLPLNLSGYTVTLILTDQAGTVISTVGDLAVTDQAGGVVTFSPDVGDLTVLGSPYRALFRAENGLGQVGFFPGTGADTWTVWDGLTAHPVHTFLDLRTQVLRWLDALEDLDTGNVLDALVKQQLNDSHNARVAEYPWAWLRSATTLNVSAGTLRYQLPGDFQRLLYVWHPGDKRFLTKVPDRMLGMVHLDGTASGSLYQPFTLEGHVLRFLEPPRGALLNLGYYRVPQPLVNPQDIPEIPYPHSRVLVWDALLDLKSYAKDLEASRLWMAKQEAAVRDLYMGYNDGGTLGEMPQLIHESITG